MRAATERILSARPRDHSDEENGSSDSECPSEAELICDHPSDHWAENRADVDHHLVRGDHCSGGALIADRVRQCGLLAGIQCPGASTGHNGEDYHDPQVG